MKTCIPIELKPQGGGYYFLEAFKAYLESIGWEVTFTPEKDTDILFTNHWMVPRRMILEAIRRKPDIRIIQRINGCAQDYGREIQADRKQGAVNKLADLTIFQSQYSRYANREKYPVIGADGPVIHNPVDINLFTPDGERIALPEGVNLACVTWSMNRKKGWPEIYEAARRYPDIRFVLCGQFPEVPQLPNMDVRGVLDREDLARTLRSCDAMLTFSQSEACPNHVLEALASGLPVLYRDSGAMAEIIEGCGFEISIEDLAAKVTSMKRDRDRITRDARQRCLERFNPNIVFPRYLDEMLDTVKKPPRVSPTIRKSLAWSAPLVEPVRSFLFE